MSAIQETYELWGYLATLYANKFQTLGEINDFLPRKTNYSRKSINLEYTNNHTKNQESNHRFATKDSGPMSLFKEQTISCHIAYSTA